MRTYINELYHHGIKGQKWGVRRYQNSDGTLTEAGRKRYGINDNGWMTTEGKRILRSDRKEQDDIFAKQLEKLPKSERTNAYRKYIDENDGDVWKNLQKQEMIEDRLKDYKTMSKLYRTKGVDTVVAINNRGKMSLVENDPLLLGDATKKGYTVVNSMSDIMNVIKVSDVVR